MRKILVLTTILLLVLTGCNDNSVITDIDGGDEQLDSTGTPVVEITQDSENNSETPTVVVDATDTAAPTDTPAPTPTVQPTNTPEPTPNFGDEMREYLPPIDKVLSYYGYAEYGHNGSLYSEGDDVYRFDGVYDDASGANDAFSIKYYFDTARGTITEQVASSERNTIPEVNSKLHNVVLLKFPLELNATWHHTTTINDEKFNLEATITEYDSTTGDVKVLYIVEGVTGYYRERYIEERVFKKGLGMTGFSNNFAGDLYNPPADDTEQAYWNAVRNEMFGYTMYIN